MRRDLLLVAGLGAVLLGATSLAPSLAQNNPVSPEETALTSQKETTLARRLLMHSLGASNDIVHDILDGTLPMDELELRGRLQSIGAMIYAMPSLYRAAANPYTDEGEKADSIHVSLASQALWDDFENFNLRANEAFYKAEEASDAPMDQMLARVEELEVMCESCHEAYRKPFDFFDFDKIDQYLK